MNNELAKSGYEAYCRAAGQEKPTTSFEALPESWKEFWRSSAKAVLVSWVESEFHEALHNDEFVMRCCMSYMAKAKDEGFSASESVKTGVGAFVLHLIKPEEMV